MSTNQNNQTTKNTIKQTQNNTQTKHLGLYVHIPFCEKKCDYCDFVSFCKPNQDKLKYINSLCAEIVAQGVKFKDYEVDTIYIGGGTPSCLPNGAISLILHKIYQNFKVLKTAEITIECNPNSVDVAKLQEYRRSKINRLSIGLQAYNNKLLKLIGRLHTKADFDTAISRAKLIGFKNISVDVIIGLPQQKMHHIKHQLKHLKKLGIKHISAYGLMVEEGTKLAQNLKQGVYKLPSDLLQEKMYDYTKKYLQKNGYVRYEVSNFALPKYESQHNLKYWTNCEYLGLGLNASSYVNCTRWRNTDNFDEYVKTSDSCQLKQYELEVVDTDSQMEECIMLSLRTCKGIDLTNFFNRFNVNLLQSKSTQIDNLKKDGLVVIKDNCLVCTDRGFKFLNQVILQLI